MITSLLSDIRKRKHLLNLNQKNVLIVDSSSTSNSYFQVQYPNEFTSGKNSITIKPTSNLKFDSDILIEIIDENNNQIYSENVNYKTNDDRYVISIYVYPETINSVYTITILGIAEYDAINNQEIPNEWKNKYNLKWNLNIDVDIYKNNVSEIIFNEFPSLQIEKKFVSYYDISYPVNKILIASGSSNTSYYYMMSNPQSVYNIEEYERKTLDKTNNQSKVGTDVQLNINDSNKIRTKFIDKGDNRIELSPNTFFTYQDTQNPTIIISGSLIVSGSGSIDGFNNNMLSGKVTISNIPQITLPTGTSFSGSSDLNYEFVINRVINKNKIEASIPYRRNIFVKNQYNQNELKQYTYTKFNSSDISIEYENDPIYTSSKRYRNYAILRFNNMEPISGLIHKIKTYIKSNSTQTNYQLIDENIIQPQNLFIDENANYAETSMGDIKNTSTLSTYWQTIAPINTVFYNNDVLINAIEIVSTTYNISLGSKIGIDLFENHNYELSFNIYAIKSTSSNAQMSIDIINNTESITSTITTIVLNDNIFYYKNIKFNFIAIKDGSHKIKFRMSGGIWYLSDIQIKPLTEFGFTPKHYILKVPIQPLWANDNLNLKFEFYNSKNEMCKQTVEFKNVVFQNDEPIYISGNYNLITGSLWVSNDLQTGVEISGIEGAMIRSVGYNGWNRAINNGEAGFMIFSGSVSPGGYSENNYAGVGIEFSDGGTNSFRFLTQGSSTNPSSSFEVITDTFFLGKYGEQFLSGSNGNIEISGAGFHLSPNELYVNTENFFLGNYGSQYISGSSGNIEISSSNLYLTPTDLFINTENFFFGSYGNQFISGSGGNIEISSSHFQLSPLGRISATSGSIGGWEIRNNELFSLGGSLRTNDHTIGDRQSIFLDGPNNKFEFYISGSLFPILAIDDNLRFTGLPGILINTKDEQKDAIIYITDDQYAENFVKIRKNKIDIKHYSYITSIDPIALNLYINSTFDTNIYGANINVIRSGIETGSNDYGINISVDTNNNNTSYGIYSNAKGGNINWSAYFADGNVNIENNLYNSGSIFTSNPYNYLNTPGITGTFDISTNTILTVSGGIITNII
jgi:hypothetical protein